VRKRSEKDAEAERIKEQERVDDMSHMLTFQKQFENPSTMPTVRDYPSLQEKFLVCLFVFLL
jgi:hypothetical protein